MNTLSIRLAGVAAMVFALAGCATNPTVRPTQPAPWAALTSPMAAMEIVVSDICLTAVRENRPVEALALDHWLRPVPPRTTGSPLAVAAWRLASYSDVYVMALPDGGCSASVEAGDPKALNDAAVGLLAKHGDFRRGETLVAEDHSRTAWCTGEADRPLVVALAQANKARMAGGRRPALITNVFRAAGARPGFCPPTA
ncbi:MAG: hypothetical protein JHC96_14290 [Brevundimonas sp.]|uniref:hypothetical protein n=1 Tax=Brevundimonas sp. TaxID=1871086 RepID=UPI001A23B7BD|nr:hypothetical protein [Brevundimonas sp.]MBJ7319962.1 hypothetical protein [Brevundimonas sp.]